MGEKLSSVASPVSIILGIIGIATGHYIIGAFIGLIGVLFGFVGYSDAENNPILAKIGIFLSFVAIAWTCIFYIIIERISS